MEIDPAAATCLHFAISALSESQRIAEAPERFVALVTQDDDADGDDGIEIDLMVHDEALRRLKNEPEIAAFLRAPVAKGHVRFICGKDRGPVACMAVDWAGALKALDDPRVVAAGYTGQNKGSA